MSRQAVTKHLNLLEEANLVVTAKKRPREAALPQPRPHQRDLHALDRQVRAGPRPGAPQPQTSPGERPMSEQTRPNSSTPPTSAPRRRKCGTPSPPRNSPANIGARPMVSDWKPGSKWDMVSIDGRTCVEITGEVLESRAAKPSGAELGKPGKCRATSPNIPASPSRSKRSASVVRLNVVHDQLKAGSEMAARHLRRLAAACFPASRASWRPARRSTSWRSKVRARAPQAKVA